MRPQWLTPLPAGMAGLAGGGYTAVIAPFRGANVISLLHEGTGADILRTPGTHEHLLREKEFFGAPLLFPPNRIANGTFTRGARRYVMPLNSNDGRHYIHGILRYLPFKTTRQTRDEITLHIDMDERSPMYPYFPHVFSVTVHYMLTDAGLYRRITFINKGHEALPFGLGLHTALRAPFLPGSTPQDIRLKLPLAGRWALTEDMLPTGRLDPLTGEEACFLREGVPPLARAYATTLFKLLPPDADGEHEVILRDTLQGVAVSYRFSRPYAHLVLWNGGGRDGYVCTEPMTWIIDAPNSTLPDAESGYRALAAGEEIALVDRIGVI